MRGGRLMLLVAIIATLMGLGLATALTLQSNARKQHTIGQPH
jgi:hypothetical protein